MSMQPMLTMAVRAAKQAGEMIAKAAQQLQFIDIEVEAKGVNDFVTRVDKDAERIIIESLRKAYPIHSFQAEECGYIEGKGEGKEWVWIIDPLDGTTNFIHGFPQFAVSIAVQYKGVTEHAVVYDPLNEECFSASRGYGTTLNGRRLRVTERRGLEGSLIGTGFPFRPDQHTYLDSYLSAFKDVALNTAGIRRAGAAALDLAYVAAGRLDGFFELGLSPWDMAAGDLLIREAGGFVCDMAGGHDYLKTGNIVAGNIRVMKALVTTISPHLPEYMRR